MGAHRRIRTAEIEHPCGFSGNIRVTPVHQIRLVMSSQKTEGAKQINCLAPFFLCVLLYLKPLQLRTVTRHNSDTCKKGAEACGIMPFRSVKRGARKSVSVFPHFTPKGRFSSSVRLGLHTNNYILLHLLDWQRDSAELNKNWALISSALAFHIE